MPITMNCPSCGKTLSAPESAVGKKAKCPSCGQIMIVPEAVHEAEEWYATEPEPSTPPGPQSASGPSQNWPDEVEGSESAPTATGPGDESRRPCPVCGEQIIATAAKCRFCGAIFDHRLKPRRAYTADDEDLSGGEWFMCILCSTIGCIVGIVYAIQGKPKGMKMVGISLVAGFVIGIIRAMIQFSAENAHHFR